MFSSRHVYTTTKIRPKASIPIVTYRCSPFLKSSIVTAVGSSKTENISANEIPCLDLFLLFFDSSLSNMLTHYVYNCMYLSSFKYNQLFRQSTDSVIFDIFSMIPISSSKPALLSAHLIIYCLFLSLARFARGHGGAEVGLISNKNRRPFTVSGWRLAVLGLNNSSSFTVNCEP